MNAYEVSSVSVEGGQFAQVWETWCFLHRPTAVKFLQKKVAERNRGLNEELHRNMMYRPIRVEGETCWCSLHYSHSFRFREIELNTESL